MASPVVLSNINPTLLPPTITGPIFLKAAETSAVMPLARRVPLSVNAATAIPVPMNIPTAGWVAEAQSKPVSSGGVGVKIMTGKKVACLIPVSQEVVMTNALALYSQLEQDLPTAISRAFDHAAIHGKDLATGGAGPFGDYLAMTSNNQVVGASSAATGGLYRDLVLGEQKVVQSAGYEFTGFAADPRFKPELKLSVDGYGRPLFVSDPSMGMAGGSLIGYPAYYNPGVSGRLYRQSNLGVNEVQTVSVTGAPTGGTFTLGFEGGVSAPLAYNATAAQVQSALRALSQIDAATTVTGSAGGPYVVTFGGTEGSENVPPLVATPSLTGGSSPAVTVTETTPGVSGDTGLRAVGGDWSQCAYGVGMDISIKVSTQANYIDADGVWHSAFQENLVLLLAEAYYGFVVNTVEAFCTYTGQPGA